MGLTLTEPHLENRTIPFLDRLSGRTEILRVTPVIFIVDPDKAVRESLEQLIRCQGWHPETFTSAEEFLAYPVEAVPSCLALDVSLPGLSGLELQKRVALKRPHVPTIFLSANGNIHATVEAMKAGAVNFLAKPFRDSELLNAVREALDQSRRVLAKEREKQILRKCYASLSPRERQVMNLVSSGFLNKQIGGELGISIVTVKAHRGHMMHKMRADSLADLVKMVTRLGLSRRNEVPRLRRDDSGPDLCGVLFDTHPAGISETAC